MDDEAFWRLIALLNLSETELPPRTDEECVALVVPLRDALTALPATDIEDFYELLARRLYVIDTEAHWRAHGWPSLDGFLYARCWVVARGREFYEKVASDATAMPRWVEKGLDESLLLQEIMAIPPPALEPLLYVAVEAYREKTGAEFPYNRSVSYETGSNRAGWPDRDGP